MSSNYPAIVMRYLKNPKTGVIFPWTPLLARRRDLIPCDEIGRPQGISDNDPYVVMETGRFMNKLLTAMSDAGRPMLARREQSGKSDVYALPSQYSRARLPLLAFDQPKPNADAPFIDRLNWQIEDSASKANVWIDRKVNNSLGVILSKTRQAIHELDGIAA